MNAGCSDRVRAVWRDEALSGHFERLTELLKAGEQFWRHHAFKYLQLPWESEFPELSKHLRALLPVDAERFARNDAALRASLCQYLPELSAVGSACAIGAFDVAPLPADAEPRDVPGRKWQQIRHFAPCVPENEFALLEWCSGKAHLGRMLAKGRNSSITALEYDAGLVEAGKKQAARDRVAIDFRCIDVMSAAAADVIGEQHNAIALHACGDLHVRLLALCAQKRTRTVTLAPCCYQLTGDEARYTVSQAARVSGLRLQRDDLRTAVHGTVTAAPRESRAREQLQAWRLGFDVLQREVRGCDEYLPTPSLSVNALKAGFATFCCTLAEMKQIKLPDTADYLRYERAGYERLREVTALDLPRLAFRRALELWLALDRAAFLREQGYAVTLGMFCGRKLTPRNILIRAERR